MTPQPPPGREKEAAEKTAEAELALKTGSYIQKRIIQERKDAWNAAIEACVNRLRRL